MTKAISFCKRSIISFLFLFPAIIFAQEAVRKSVEISIFEDLASIKDWREIDLPAGVSTIQLTDIPDSINISSLHIYCDGKILEQSSRNDCGSISDLLKAYINQNIKFQLNDTIHSGTLLTLLDSQASVRINSGRILFIPNTQKCLFFLKKTSSELVYKPTYFLKVFSPQSKRSAIQISYQTKFIGRDIGYNAIINKDETTMSLTSPITIYNSTGIDFKNANVKIYAKSTSEANTYQLNKDYSDYSINAQVRRSLISIIGYYDYREALFGKHNGSALTIKVEKPLNLLTGSILILSNQINIDIPIVKHYIFSSSLGYNSSYDSFSNCIFLDFINDKKSGLGFPLFNGKFNIYKDDGKSTEFIGEDKIDFASPADTCFLQVGKAFDITVNRIFKTELPKNTTGEIELQYKVANRKSNENVEIKIGINLKYDMDFKIISSDEKYQNVTKDGVVLVVPIKKDSEKIIKCKLLLSKRERENE